MFKKIALLTEFLFNSHANPWKKKFLELILMYRLFVAATLPNLGITQHDSWGTHFLVPSFG
jgi:hypothetical protein